MNIQEIPELKQKFEEIRKQVSKQEILKWFDEAEERELTEKCLNSSFPEDSEWITGIENGRGYIEFPKGNMIQYDQDFTTKCNMPSGIKFYPFNRGHNTYSIRFIGDRYGILGNNKWGLKGSYGNGAIYIQYSELPDYVIGWCIKNSLEK